MILYPAIDLKDGICVRLLRGEMSQATIFNCDPAEQAIRFERQGFQALHVVDLDGAHCGQPVNQQAVIQILKATSLPVQVGGGIRDLPTIEYWLEQGVHRVILGSTLLVKPELVKQACLRYPGRIAASLDARNGYVAIEGWVATSSHRALDLALQCDQWGLAALIYTDIERDGTLTGHNIEQTCDLAMALQTPIIASGGISSLHDLYSLKEHHATGIEGVIVGRALYENKIDAAQALTVLTGKATFNHEG